MIHRATFWILAGYLATAATSAAQRPNILWITCEDMSTRLGCYGDSTVPTPNIDRFASQGVRYTRAFGVYGVCSPNRHCLITGMYPTSTGAMAMRTWKRTASLHLITDPDLLAIPTYEATPPARVKCFTEYLRAAGYYCTNNSKTDYQFLDPITAWDESSNQAHWRNRPDPDMPFFAVFNSKVTHESMTFQKTSPNVVDPAQVKIPPYYPDTPEVRQGLAWHYDNIIEMDRWVGDLLQQLEDDGLADETIVFFYSDHGDCLPRGKRWVYDSGIHVPLIVRFPDGREAATVNGELISFVDFAPTALALAGLDTPDYMEGQVFLGPRRAAPREFVFACRDRMDPAPETIRAVRDHRFKYIRNYRPELPYIGYVPYRDQAPIMQSIKRLMDTNQLGPDQWQFSATKKPLEELYDTTLDPHEIRNLASDARYFDKLAELRKAHDKWTAKHGDLGHLPESDLIKQLWPPAGKQPTTFDPVIRIHRERISIHCDTEGASIAYRLNGNPRWLLYVDPFKAESETMIEAQSIRLGWKRSQVVSVRVP